MNKHLQTGKIIFKELRIFGILFVIVVVIMLIVTNANLFSASFRSLFTKTNPLAYDLENTDTHVDNSIFSLLDRSQRNDAEIQALLAKYQSGRDDVTTVGTSPETFLRAKIKDYPFSFNTLPPIDKVVVKSIGLDVPLIDSKHMDATDFAQGNFDDELEQGVVKYPTTPAPGETGNTLIFGHTSQEFWKHNSYGTIFKDIPKLNKGDKIQVIRKGQLYEYSIVDKFVVLPSQVNAQYMSYANADGSYLTLMGCYPLGTDKKRLMVIGKLVK